MCLPVFALKKMPLKELVGDDTLSYKKLIMTSKYALSAQKIKPSWASLRSVCPAG